MKKVFLSVIFSIILCTPVFAQEVLHDDKVYYSEMNNSWNLEPQEDAEIVLTKKLYEGTGSYSKYLNQDGSLAFALSTGCEIIKNGKLIVVDNNLLKYYKVICEDGYFYQELLTDEEIQEAFPEAEIIKISWIDEDNKLWIHKPFFRKKIILLVNDTDRYFHKLTCKRKSAQDEKINGLITLPFYGFYRFTHFGERNGKLIFYVR